MHRFLISTLALLCFSTSTVLAAPPATVLVGILAPFTDPNSSPPVIEGIERPISEYHGFNLGSHGMAAAQYQIDQINNAASPLLPQTKIIFKYYDDQQTAARGQSGASELISNGSLIILGGSTSSVSSGAAPVAAASNGMPMVSWSSGSASLANKTTYPTFMRLNQNDAVSTAVMIYLVKSQFSWNDIAIIYTTDTLGTNGYLGLKAAAESSNINIVTAQSFPSGATADVITPKVQAIKNAGVRIILYFGLGPDWAAVASVAKSESMFNAQTVWFLSNSPVSAALTYTAQQLADWHGVIGIAPDSGSDTTTYQNWLSGFIARPVNPIPELRWNGTAADVSFFTAFAADAINTLAYALKKILYTDGQASFTNAQLLSALKAVDFDGVTGRVRFDANGDRIGINFILKNMQDSTWVNIGKVVDNAGSFAWTAGTKTIKFYDGTSTTPSSTLAPADTLGAAYSIASVSVAVLMMLTFTATRAAKCV